MRIKAIILFLKFMSSYLKEKENKHLAQEQFFYNDMSIREKKSHPKMIHTATITANEQ